MFSIYINIGHWIFTLYPHQRHQLIFTRTYPLSIIKMSCLWWWIKKEVEKHVFDEIFLFAKFLSTWTCTLYPHQRHQLISRRSYLLSIIEMSCLWWWIKKRISKEHNPHQRHQLISTRTQSLSVIEMTCPWWWINKGH